MQDIHTQSMKIIRGCFLYGNCELITSSVDEMIKHKRGEHNIIWNDGYEVKGKGDGKGDSGGGKVSEGEVGVDEGDVIKKRAWNDCYY